MNTALRDLAVTAAIGLGGNLGDVATTLHEALQALDALPQTRLLRASRLYRTPAWGRTEQPDFINGAALLQTRLDARDLPVPGRGPVAGLLAVVDVDGCMPLAGDGG